VVIVVIVVIVVGVVDVVHHWRVVHVHGDMTMRHGDWAGRT
jgi:hypothetical protein